MVKTVRPVRYRSHFGAWSVYAGREHGKRAGTPLVAFFNIPLVVNLIVSVGWFGTLHASVTTDPTAAVKEMVDEVISILQNEELKGEAHTLKRRALLEQAVARRLDYEEMAKRTLARYWKKRTPEERQEFVKLFHRFLSKNYAHRLETYSDERVQYTKTRLKGSYAEVQTVITSAKTELHLDYRLVRKDDQWWIYDIVINGVSLVKNYRDQFERVIRKSSYADLVAKLRDRAGEIATP